jgi:2-polyprenyl-3-methyl-5-hydroxy-6-metoxy-1,4-benzoquinol methylase
MEEDRMPTEEKPKTGKLNGRLWGARARDWADLQEPMTRPVYDAVFQRIEMDAQTNYLDVGCGSGLAAQLAAERQELPELMQPRTSLLLPNHEWRPGSFV